MTLQLRHKRRRVPFICICVFSSRITQPSSSLNVAPGRLRILAQHLPNIVHHLLHANVAFEAKTPLVSHPPTQTQLPPLSGSPSPDHPVLRLHHGNKMLCRGTWASLFPLSVLSTMLDPHQDVRYTE